MVGVIAANAAIAIVGLGGEALLASRVGGDLVGERIMSDLALARVDRALVEWLNGVRSSISTILIDAAGERLVNHGDSTLFRGTVDLDGLAVDAVMVERR